MSISHAQFVNLDPSAIMIASNVRSDAGYEIDSLELLADSIATYGLMQPVVVSRKRGRFELVAGHRRVLAAQMAGLASVPAVVQDVPENERTARQLVENVHRTNLSMSDTAQAVRALHDEHGSLSLVADMLGKSRSWTCKMLALTAGATTSLAMKLVQDEVISDLEIAALVARIEKMNYDGLHQLEQNIRSGKHTRESLQKTIKLLTKQHIDKQREQTRSARLMDIADAVVTSFVQDAQKAPERRAELDCEKPLVQLSSEDCRLLVRALHALDSAGDEESTLAERDKLREFLTSCATAFDE